jgi:phage tail sheath protein FI
LDENAFGEPGSRRGFGALGQNAFNLLVMPVDEAGDAVQKAARANAAGFCRARLAFYIVDPPAQWKTVDDATAIDSVGITGDDARYAAVYFPRVMKSNQVESFAASGIIAGVMARSDAAQGVWKAPAGTEAVLEGIVGLDIKKPIDDRDNGQLNPIGVNCLRQFPVIGNVVWGARTMRGSDQLNDDYKYIPVRRLANYIEQSLTTSLQWTVFEPNDARLWEAVRLQSATFMQSLFLQGAFAGTTSGDAYYVTCDNTTTTIVDIENGIVNVIVAFAPSSPAEFVVLQIQAVAGQSGS